MIRVSGQLTMADGTVIPLEAGQQEFAAWEIYALRNGLPADFERAPKLTMLRYLGYAAQNRGTPKPDWEPFEIWDAEVLEVEMSSAEGVEDVGAGVPPTQTDRSAG